MAGPAVLHQKFIKK